MNTASVAASSVDEAMPNSGSMRRALTGGAFTALAAGGLDDFDAAPAERTGRTARAGSGSWPPPVGAVRTGGGWTPAAAMRASVVGAVGRAGDVTTAGGCAAATAPDVVGWPLSGGREVAPGLDGTLVPVGEVDTVVPGSVGLPPTLDGPPSVGPTRVGPPGGATTGDETTGDETTGDETTGDETTGDETTGDETVGDETVGDETVGDEVVDGGHGVLVREPPGRWCLWCLPWWGSLSGLEPALVGWWSGC